MANAQTFVGQEDCVADMERGAMNVMAPLAWTKAITNVQLMNEMKISDTLVNIVGIFAIKKWLLLLLWTKRDVLSTRL